MAIVFIGSRYFFESDYATVWMSFGHWMSALLATIIRHIYAATFCVFLIGTMFGYGYNFSKFTNYGVYRILGRLTFSVYMVHFTITIVLMSQQKFPLEISTSTKLAWLAIVYILR